MLLGPLTTTWTPPSACTTWASDVNPAFSDIFFQYRTCAGGVPEDAAPCWPSATTTPTPGTAVDGFGYYSPGLYCPSGYTSACTQAILPNGAPSPMTSGVSFSFQFAPKPGETAIGCCPIGMGCTTEFYHFQTCSTDFINLATSVTVGTCNTDTESQFASVQEVTVRTAQFWAPLIQIIHQSSDITEGVATATATTMTTSTAIPQVSPTGPLTSSTSAPQSSSSSGPSTNTIGVGVGIGIGAAVFLILCILALWFVFHRRRNARNTNQQTGPLAVATPYKPMDTGHKIEMQPNRQTRIEIDGNPMYQKP